MSQAGFDSDSDPSSSSQSWFTYNPYGALSGSTGTATSLIGYAGQYTDPTSSLEYNQARWYDPDSGQFMIVDPKVQTTWQAYAYSNDDPISNGDPLGNMASGCDMGFDEVYAGSPVPGSEFYPDSNWTPPSYPPDTWEPTTVLYSSAGDPLNWTETVGSDDIFGPKVTLTDRKGDLPGRGDPDSTAVRDDGKGHGQIRDYGPDGRAVKDFDFGHDHTGAGDPHAHDWDWSKSPARQGPRPIGLGE